MKMHVFIDGTWLFRACGPNKVLASQTESPVKAFPLDFSKLNNTMKLYVEKKVKKTIEIGDCYISTSIITLPANIDDLPSRDPEISEDMLKKFKKGVYARNLFVDNATKASVYKDDAIFRPNLKTWMIRKIAKGGFQEKQVDTTIVAMLVRSAIKNPEDFHVVMTGDADILPAIRIAYPEYTKNVLIVTTDPDELKADWRQASYSISNFEFDLPPLYLQEVAEEVISGSNVYRCKNCSKVYVKNIPLPNRKRAFCTVCEKLRT